MFGLGGDQIAIALVAALAAAFVRGLAGFGMAILLVPVLGLAIPPSEAVVTSNWLGIFIGLVGLKALLGHQPSPIETGGTGIACGVLTGFAGMPGVPVVPFYLRRQIAPQLARASMMTIFIATSIAGVGSAVVLRVATWRELGLAALLFPAVLLGNTLGNKAFGKVSDTAWRLFVGFVLGATALAALWRLLHA